MSHPLSRHRRTALRVLLVLSLAGALWLAAPGAVHQLAMTVLDYEAKDAQRTNTAPNFTLKQANGVPLRLTDFKGQVVVLNFWATWCGPCKVEIPWFIAFEDQYKAKGFSVIGVSMDEEGWKAVTPYAAEQKINYPLVIGNEQVNQLYGGIESLPTTLILGRDGHVRFIHTGLVPRATYEKEIRELLAS